jgi:hypothetical protein
MPIEMARRRRGVTTHVRSLSSRIFSALNRLDRSLDSLWFYLVSLLSDLRARWSTVGCVGIIASILGIIGFLLDIAPKISIGSSGSLQAANPMATVFYLSNDGLLPVHDILAKCGALQFKAGNFEIESDKDAGFIFSDSKAEILSPGHQMTLPCAHLIGPAPGADAADITKAEFTVIVTYRPHWLPWHKTERFPQRAEKAEGGNWIWKSLPR